MSWNRGDKAELAERCGVGRSMITDIVKCRAKASVSLAKRIEENAKAMGLDISRMDVLYPEESKNPLIGG